MIYRAGLLCLSALVPAFATEPCTLVTLDFAMLPDGTPLQGGTYVQNEWESAFGLTLSASGGLSNKPRLFDTYDVGNKDFGDADLGSPNMRCSPPGPGVGEGGEPGMPGENCVPLGNVLIIQEDNDHPEQPDDNVDGGTITFGFTQTRKIYEIGLLDVDYDASITVVSKDRSGKLISNSISVSLLGDNSAQIVRINQANVVQLILNLSRSGAVTFLSFCGEQPATPTVAPTPHPSLRPPTSPPTPAPLPTPPLTPKPTPPPPTPPPTHPPTPKPTTPPTPPPTSPPTQSPTDPPTPKPTLPPTPFPTRAECATPTSAPTRSTGGPCMDNSECETGFCWKAFPPQSPGVCACNLDTNQGCEYSKTCAFAPGTFAQSPSCYVPMGGFCYSSSECLSGNCHNDVCVCNKLLNYPCSNDETCTFIDLGYACRKSACSTAETCTKPVCNPNVGECPFAESPVTCPDGCKYSNPCFADEAGFGLYECSQDFLQGPTGNLYKAVTFPSRTWNEANGAIHALAEECGGISAHLATITSREEDEFVHFMGRMRHRYYTSRGHWVGGYKKTGSVWEWVNNEGPVPTQTRPLSKYSNWGPNKPNDISGEQYMTVCLLDEIPEDDKATGWSDLDVSLSSVHGYVVEVEVEPTVMIEECDTHVDNLRLPPLSENCPPGQISTLIAGCLEYHDFVTDRGPFVECVAHITNALKDAALISDKEKDRIVSCALKGNNIPCIREWQQLGGGPEFGETSHPYKTIVGEAAGDQFGTSVSLSANGPSIFGSWLAVGARFNDGGGKDSGHVRRYEWNGCGQLFFKIGGDIDGEAAGDFSGFAVSLSDDAKRVAVGAYLNDGDDGKRLASGHVRVYDGDLGSRQLGADLDGKSSFDFFGFSVSLSATGSIVAAGAPRGGRSVSGYVRVYEWNGVIWNKLGDDIEGSGPYDNAGTSVSLSADGLVVAVGAPGDQSVKDFVTGYVQVYEFKGGNWHPLGGRLDGKRLGNQFGQSVSLSPDGMIMAVGAPEDKYKILGGNVCIYRWNGESWIQIGDDIYGMQSEERFGWSVSLSANGNIVAISGILSDRNGVNSGHVVLYKWNGVTWNQVQDFVGEAARHISGYSVSLSSDGAAVAIGSIGAGKDSAGHVRVFSCKVVGP